MADKANRYPNNVPGKFYVDNQCIDCDLCRETAPENFMRSNEGGFSYVSKQPATRVEANQCKEAKEGCPVEAIGSDMESQVVSGESHYRLFVTAALLHDSGKDDLRGFILSATEANETQGGMIKAVIYVNAARTLSELADFFHLSIEPVRDAAAFRAITKRAVTKDPQDPDELADGIMSSLEGTNGCFALYRDGRCLMTSDYHAHLADQLYQLKMEVESTDEHMVDQNSTSDLKPSTGDGNALSHAQEIMTVANQYYFGHGDTLEDTRRALKLFRQAASLGHAMAYWRIGEILLDDEEFKNEAGALDAFNRGAGLGEGRCWAEIACYYSRKGHAANAMKAWARWFKCEIAQDPDAPTMVSYGIKYLEHVRNKKAPDDFLTSVAPFRDVILAAARKSLDEAGTGFRVPSRTRELGIVRDLLFPEVKRYLTFGRVSFVCQDNDDGRGGLINAKETDFYFLECDLIDGTLINKGEEVGFDAASFEHDGKSQHRALNVRKAATFRDTQAKLPLYSTCPFCNGVVRYSSSEIGKHHKCACGSVLVLP